MSGYRDEDAAIEAMLACEPKGACCTCPTCGSNNREKRQKMWLGRGNFGYCPDAWHKTARAIIESTAGSEAP